MSSIHPLPDDQAPPIYYKGAAAIEQDPSLLGCNCQDLVLGDKDGVLFLTERRVLSLADPYLPEERQIASPSNCAQQRQKLPTPWSRATRYHTVPHAPIHAHIHLDPAGEKERGSAYVSFAGDF
ncbi:hypothetical protein KOW79_016241 [Hemibagrus wyckioides]|uniref:Uncharacterized protein n=1 Tax=Hemibagrus wyckioides TaxID=337641 RepID=A0A9D3SI85_9TELE|nr:hypothetical protein KOW79_016241 [Hemibagrus wyckioides]